MEICFVLVGRNNRKYLNDGKAFPLELQHGLKVTDTDKRNLKIVMMNGQTV